jgi:hypothetical protein
MVSASCGGGVFAARGGAEDGEIDAAEKDDESAREAAAERDDNENAESSGATGAAERVCSAEERNFLRFT